MKVVVTTPTGHVGWRAARLLLQAGVRPTLLARHPARLDPRVVDHADVVQADQADADAVVRATRAVTENGIARTVFLSSIGAEMRSGAGAIDGLARTEELLGATGASVLSLRCGFFFTNLLFDLDSLRNGVVGVAAPVDYARSIVTTTPTTLAAWAHAHLRPLLRAESAT